MVVADLHRCMKRESFGDLQLDIDGAGDLARLQQWRDLAIGETIDLGKFGLRLAEIWNLPLDERGDLTTNHLGRIETRARNPDFAERDRKSTRLNSSHSCAPRMPSS